MIKTKMVEQLVSNFTTGRTDEGYYEFSREEIKTLLELVDDKLNETACKYITAYLQEYCKVEYPENDWIREWCTASNDETDRDIISVHLAGTELRYKLLRQLGSPYTIITSLDVL